MLPPRWERLLHVLRRSEEAKTFDEDLELGSILTLGRFEIVVRIGAGGMGAVFGAYDPELNRRVALKICKLPADEAAGLIEHEARCLAQLAHPNVITVYDVISDGPDLVLVMEYVDGRTLRAWQCDELPDWPEVIHHYIEAAQGLDAAHAVGLEHGDFKPDNVLIGDDGRIRVIDFGIARHSYDLIEDPLELKFKGTRSYMAPERLRGQHGGVPADVYALCVSLWEALYGARPFSGPTVVAQLEAIEAGTPTMGAAIFGVPEGVRAVLLRGLSARASERPQSMAELILALREACEGAQRRRTRWWRWVTRGVVAAVLLVSVGLIWRPEPSPIEKTLALAEAEARDRDAESAADYLELARKQARQEGDHDALRRVGEVAERLGDLAIMRGDRKGAGYGWSVAYGVFLELGDEQATERITKLLAAVAEPTARR